MNTEALLGLLHISSPALPVGAFAYSQGLETAIDRGWCHNGESTATWILELLEQGMASLDVPVFCRLYQGWKQHDQTTVELWNSTLLTFRETRELYDDTTNVASRRWWAGRLRENSAVDGSLPDNA